MPPTLLFDRSDRTRLQFSGAQAVATLNGLVTNDVAALKPGEGAYAAALTAKGKMLADLRIFMRGEDLLVDTSAKGSAGLRDMFKKYVNPRFAHITDVTTELGDLGVFGDNAGQVVALAVGVSPEALTELGPYAQLVAPLNGATVTIARVPDLSTVGYDLFVPSAHIATLRDALLSAGAVLADAKTWHMLRVIAGRPEWGVDMDENTLPQEANLESLHGLSHNKGCYVGQETVARIHFRGHVNRTLRRLGIDAGIEPPVEAELIDGQEKVVGDVRSTARPPIGDFPQAVLGIGMVRREVEDGATLTARWSDGEVPIRVLGPAVGNAKGATD
jgi:folate-binding protein YgfZ